MTATEYYLLLLRVALSPFVCRLAKLAEWSSWSARKFHMLEVAGSSPASAPKSRMP